MHHIYQTEGIVINGINSGDSNRKIYLLGREIGLIVGKVQSGRSLPSKLRSAVQDFTFGNYSLVRGKNEWKVVGARTSINIFESVRKNPEKIRIMANVLHLIKRLVLEGRESVELFDSVKVFMLHLPLISAHDLKSAECLILLRVLNKLGFLRSDPDLIVCIEEAAITPEIIGLVSTHRRKTVKLINESLYAAEIANK